MQLVQRRGAFVRQLVQRGFTAQYSFVHDAKMHKFTAHQGFMSAVNGSTKCIKLVQLCVADYRQNLKPVAIYSRPHDFSFYSINNALPANILAILNAIHLKIYHPELFTLNPDKIERKVI